MIPKIFHQFFFPGKTGASIPSIWKGYTKKLKKLHPRWQYIYWNADNIQEVLQHYPAFARFFTDGMPPVIKSDIGRYIVLHRFGGWYLDFDYEVIQALDTWNTHNVVLPTQFPHLPEYREKISIGNAILASQPGNFFIQKILDTIQRNNTITTTMTKQGVFESTGPDMISRLYAMLTDSEKQQCSLIDAHVFHTHIAHMCPAKDYKALLKKPHVFGLHHSHNSWDDEKWIKNIKRRSYAKNPFIFYLYKMYHNIKNKR